ncbi:MAG: sigma-54 dependent transcriptional regulator [Muribaculaceae bacterium]|nr:sigma-54 dependent transcriptional regulator [Muribaculaceae bacterium]
MEDKEIKSVKQRFSIIGNSPALLNAIGRAVKVAPIDLSVLITGESGTGKEFFPRIIHNSGSRKHKKYIAVNCGAIPEGTIDSELFGHEKGAFTGAVSSRKGYFEEADGGTIFLDEVAELPLTTQARLLRVLETGEFLKVGSSTVQKTDVRIVAATNVNLPEAVAAGRFREDLYYRLSTVIIDVPPLSDRGDDILLLARKFAADFSEKYLTAPISFSEEARHAMLIYRWPGNVRQLKNVIEQLALFNAGEEISRRTLIDALPAPARDSAEGKNVPYADHHSYQQERDFLWQTLFAMRAEIAELKAALGMPSSSSSRHSSPALLTKLSPRSSAKDLLAPDEISDYGPEESSGMNADPITLEEAEKEAVASALRRNNGDKKLAAEQLNISQRTLYRKIKEYGLD